MAVRGRVYAAWLTTVRVARRGPGGA